VGPNDVSPEQLPTFLFPAGRGRDLFVQLHGDLLHPAFWLATQQRIRAEIQDDIFPYPEKLRFENRYR
jgi:isocitrate dehydrogenase kinase/phosphatase